MPESSDEAFIRYAQAWGGHQPTSMSERLKTTLGDELGIVAEMMNSLRRYPCINRRGRRLRLACGVTRALDANAFADTDGRWHFFGLTFGQFLTATYLSVELFSRSAAFRGIGSSPQASTEPLDLNPDGAFWQRRGRAFFDEIASIDETDEERRSAARYLRYAMSIFAAFHEYAHVIGGHCSAAGALGLGTRRSETGSGFLDRERGRVSRCLEYLADDTAVRLLTVLVIDNAGPYEEGADYKLDLETRLRLALVGTALLTTSWHSWHAKTGAQVTSHPAPDLRFLALHAAAKDVAVEKGNVDAFERARDAAYEDLARASIRSPELAVAIRSFIERSRGRVDWMVETEMSDALAKRLANEAFSYV